MMDPCEMESCPGLAAEVSPLSQFRGLCEDCIERIFEERSIGRMDNQD
jgi:hypothetical protein